MRGCHAKLRHLHNRDLLKINALYGLESTAEIRPVNLFALVNGQVRRDQMSRTEPALLLRQLVMYERGVDRVVPEQHMICREVALIEQHVAQDRGHVSIHDDPIELLH